MRDRKQNYKTEKATGNIRTKQQNNTKIKPKNPVFP